MRPSRRLLQALLALAAAALLPALLRLAEASAASAAIAVWWLAFALLAATALTDSLRRGAANALSVERQLPGSLSLGNINAASVTLHNPGSTPLHLQVMEDMPDTLHVTGLPAEIVIAPGQALALHYQLRPTQRGLARFGPLWLRITSPWGLWQWRLRRGASAESRVFPSFNALSHFGAIGLERELGELGVHRQPRRGQGMEFQQLREFRPGDALRQIDWKASSRYRKPISREYQEERDQHLIFLLDCGRRLHTRDGELSHFDNALNALLLTAQLALRQGDAVGLLTFAHAEGQERWLAPRKGAGEIHTLLNQLYDLHSGTTTSDYLAVAQRLLQRSPRRALVVLVSDVREEDSDDLQAAVRLLRGQHRVVVASLREPVLDAQRDKPITGFDDALAWIGSEHYRTRRERLLRHLREEGVFVVDALPQALHAALASQYLQIKRAGVL